MNFLILLALIALLFLYSKWFANVIIDLIPKIKAKISKFKQRTNNTNNTNQNN